SQNAARHLACAPIRRTIRPAAYSVIPEGKDGARMAEPLHADEGRRDVTRTSQPPGPGAYVLASDDDLLRIYCASGSPGALSEIVGRHYPMVFRTCLRLLANFHDAEDVAQATFLLLAQRPHAVRRVLSGWLYEMARGIASNLRRVTERRRRRERVVGLPGGATASERELREELDAALLQLPRPLREAVILRYLEGRSQEEAAQVAGCPQGTLARRSAEGLRRLKAILERRGILVSLALLLSALHAGAMLAAPPPPASVTRDGGQLLRSRSMIGSGSFRLGVLAGLIALALVMLGVGIAVIVREGSNSVPLPSSAEK